MGRDNESVAITLYNNLCGDLIFIAETICLNDISCHDNFKLQSVGLCIDKNRPWYGTSPDGVLNWQLLWYGCFRGEMSVFFKRVFTKRRNSKRNILYKREWGYEILLG